MELTTIFLTKILILGPCDHVGGHEDVMLNTHIHNPLPLVSWSDIIYNSDALEQSSHIASHSGRINIEGWSAKEREKSWTLYPARHGGSLIEFSFYSFYLYTSWHLKKYLNIAKLFAVEVAALSIIYLISEV